MFLKKIRIYCSGRDIAPIHKEFIVTNKISKHIDSVRMVINISGAKGRKGRIPLLPDNVLQLLRKYNTVYIL